MTSEKFEFLVPGELVCVMSSFILLCSRYFVEGMEMQPHRQTPHLPLFVSENLSEMSSEAFQSQIPFCKCAARENYKPLFL